MDFTTNGFDWVVNLRQTFEAVCIEVEDKLCQEAKQLENHVQTFYADVIQDLLPSSCMSPVLEKVSGSPVVKNSDGVNEDQIIGKPSHKESGVVALGRQDCHQAADSTADCDIHNENHIFLPLSNVNLASKGSEKTLKDNDNLETSKLAIENDHSAKIEKYAPHPSEVVLPVSNQASLSSIPCNTICLEPQTSCGGVALSTHKDDEILIYKQFKIDHEEKALTMEPPSEASSLVCSSIDCNASSFLSEIRDEEHNRVYVPLPTSASTEVIGGLKHSQDSELSLCNIVDAVECIADVSTSSQSCDLDHPVVLLPSESEGSFNVDVGESCMENIELYDNIKLGDSCIVVDKIDLQVPPRSNNRRSFKHALASRMRSTKQREYEQLAILYGDIDADITGSRAYSKLCILDKDAHLNIPSAQCDSDWELV